ncbi:hypothetical protein MY5147_009403 [Beauveria neobassiana]
MCTTKVFVTVHQDGHRSTTSQVLLCPASRRNRPCADHTVVQQPASRDQLPHAPAAPAISFPPTPEYSPRPSDYSPRPSNYSPRPSSRGSADPHSSRHSSRHSSTSSSQRREPGIYVNGQRMVNVYSSSSRPERVMLVPHPPTPRTPPQSNSMPRTAPSSPSANLAIPYSSSPRQHYNQPYLVDERQRGLHHHHHHHHHVAVQPASPASSSSSRHSRQTSASSQGSRRSFSSAADDEERRRRRDERGERRSSRKTDELRDRIKHANDEIANRPAVRTVGEQQPQPQSQQPVTERRSRRDGHEELVGVMSRLNVEDKNWRQRRAYEKAAMLEQEEIEAQNQRMRERTVPQRRATVGPGSRRHRIAYDDGLYRWE